jgi:hypothetical protein
MDLQTMESQVYNVLRDTARSYFDKEEVDQWLNDAQLDLATRLELLQYEWTGTTTTYQVALPTSPALVHLSRLRVGGYAVTFVDDDVWWEVSDAASGDATAPIARIFNGNFEIAPTPSSGTAYVVRGSREPTALSAPNDTSALPAQLHPKMVKCAQYQALLKDGSPRWEEYMQEYERSLPSPPTGIVKLIPGPLVMRLAPGPFDLDPQAQHL